MATATASATATAWLPVSCHWSPPTNQNAVKVKQSLKLEAPKGYLYAQDTKTPKFQKKLTLGIV